MVPRAFVRQYAVSQQIDEAVADQEIVLHYALTLLNELGLLGLHPHTGESGPLLFKGGTALRKCVFGSTGRFSQDIDLDSIDERNYEEQIEEALVEHGEYHGISFEMPTYRYSAEGNFSGGIRYRHDGGSGEFELQISYRLDPVLEPRVLDLQPQSYLRHVECGTPSFFGLDPYEMIGEKLMACNRRVGGSGKDVYDLFLWSGKPFEERLVRRLAVLKAWTDQRRAPAFDPAAFLQAVAPKNFRWEDISRLVPRKHGADHAEICNRVRSRFAFLALPDESEASLLADQFSHRERRLFGEMRAEAREWAGALLAR